ncbi:MAG: TonB-dependent receptor [Alphaproteobacteria bacterium]
MSALPRCFVSFFALAAVAPAVLAQEPAAIEDVSTVETVVVTASPLAGSADRFATSVDVVGREDILSKGGANLADALAGLPGVTGTGTAAGASRPVIRGFDANRVRLLEDGIGAFDASDMAPDHGVPIDPLSAQRIEIVRGAATLRYGSQAIGGVVNAINYRVPLALPEDGFSGEASGIYGTNAGLWQGSAMADMRLGQFALHADAFARDAGDYDTPKGRMANSFVENRGYSLGGSYFFGKSRIGAAIIQYDADYGIPAEEAHIEMQQTKALTRSSFALDAGALQTLNVDAGYADYEHHEVEDGAALATFKNKEWDARAEALFGEIGPLAASALGVQLQRRDFSGLGAAADFLLPTRTLSQAVFGFTEVPLTGRVTLQAGARAEHVTVDGTSPVTDEQTKPSFVPVSGSIGLVFKPVEGLTVGLTASSAARAPAQTELFAHGPHEATGTFEIGDPDLKIERANSLEATLRYRNSEMEAEASLWSAWFDGYIFSRLTGRTCDEDGNCLPADSEEFKELFYEQRNAHFYGAEAKASYALYRNLDQALTADFLTDFVRAKFDDGTNVPRIPPYRLGAGLSWEDDDWDAGFMFVYSGRQDDVEPPETPTPGFADLDARIAWRPFSSTPEVEISLMGHNLTDAVQRNAVALNKDEVILPGRNIRLVLRTTF